MKIKGEGPVPARVMIVGPYGGFHEDRTGRPFTGKVGAELERFLDGVTLPTRRSVYLTNLHKQFKGQDYVYTHEDVEQDLPELMDELQRVQPRVVVTMGREVTRLFLGDVDVQDVQGLPWFVNSDRFDFLKQRATVVFPMVHIAAGMRNSDLSVYVVSGFQALAAHLRREVAPRRMYDDPYAGKEHYEEITTTQRLDALTSGWDSRTVVSLDTEGWPRRPWSLQFTVDAGTGYLIRARRTDVLMAFSAALEHHRPHLVFHSALHDLQMGRSLGVNLTGMPFDDTMVMAYLLQIESQGLKAGCLRHCNMQMRDYVEIIGDKANEKTREYLRWIWQAEEQDYKALQQAEFDRLTKPFVAKDGTVYAGKKLRSLPKLPRTALQRAVSRVIQSNRPYDLWQDQVEDIRVAGYQRLGNPPEATLDDVPASVAVAYGCRDTDGTARLRDEYSRRIDTMGLRAAYELELRTYPLLDRMQQVGILPDLEQFKWVSVGLSGEIKRLRTSLVIATGKSGFNANSGDQVADYLFGTLKLEEIKLTSSGRGSTNDKILEALEHEHPEHSVISDIRAYREVYKLKHTFVDRMPEYVNRWPHDGRVHTTLRTTRVVSGRLAAADPNLLAQPEHGDFAHAFKRGWIAAPGHAIYAADQSQVELRVLADLSQDPFLLHAFRTGVDLHAALAERIFGVKANQQDKHRHRYPAKTIHYLMCMGGTAYGLMVQLRANGMQVDEDTAQRWMDDTFKLYAGVPKYMQRMVKEAEKHGYIRCPGGRIRYIGGIHSRDERVRAEAERFALSTPLQAGAQYLMKLGEARIWEEVLPAFWKRGQWVEPLLQVHDSLKFECEAGLVRELHAHVRAAMTAAPKEFTVPLTVDAEYGDNMADVTAIKE